MRYSVKRVLSEQTKKKIGLANKGKKRSLEIRKAISLKLIGRIPWNKNKKIGLNFEHSQRMKGKTPWNKGKKLKPHTKEWKQGAREFNLANGINPPVMRNEKHPEWKGEKVSYSGLHYWIYRKLGKPETCQHCGISGLKGKQIHWANKSHEYKRELNDWLRLCARCHKEYDKNLSSIKQKYLV